MTETKESMVSKLITQLQEHLTKGVEGIYELCVLGKDGKPEEYFHMWVQKDSIGYKRGKSEKPADVRLSARDKDLLSLMQGQTNPIQAFMQGKLKIVGIDKLMGLQSKLKIDMKDAANPDKLFSDIGNFGAQLKAMMAALQAEGTDVAAPPQNGKKKKEGGDKKGAKPRAKL